MSDAETRLAAVLDLHRPWTPPQRVPRCLACALLWPCTTARRANGTDGPDTAAHYCPQCGGATVASSWTQREVRSCIGGGHGGCGWKQHADG